MDSEYATSGDNEESGSQDEGDKPSRESSKKPEGLFDCNICLDAAREPVVSLCGHLFCWPCLHQWLETRPHGQVCPVCKSIVTRDKVVPLYGRGTERKDPRDKVPPRPKGQRTEFDYGASMPAQFEYTNFDDDDVEEGINLVDYEDAVSIQQAEIYSNFDDLVNNVDVEVGNLLSRISNVEGPPRPRGQRTDEYEYSNFDDNEVEVGINSVDYESHEDGVTNPRAGYSNFIASLHAEFEYSNFDDVEVGINSVDYEDAVTSEQGDQNAIFDELVSNVLVEVPPRPRGDRSEVDNFSASMPSEFEYSNFDDGDVEVGMVYSNLDELSSNVDIEVGINSEEYDGAVTNQRAEIYSNFDDGDVEVGMVYSNLNEISNIEVGINSEEYEDAVTYHQADIHSNFEEKSNNDGIEVGINSVDYEDALNNQQDELSSNDDVEVGINSEEYDAAVTNQETELYSNFDELSINNDVEVGINSVDYEDDSERQHLGYLLEAAMLMPAARTSVGHDNEVTSHQTEPEVYSNFAELSINDDIEVGINSVDYEEAVTNPQVELDSNFDDLVNNVDVEVGDLLSRISNMLINPR